MLGMISLYSRNMPSAECWMRMEAEVGRYHHQNLFQLCWIERLLAMEDDVEMKVLEKIKDGYVNKSHLI